MPQTLRLLFGFALKPTKLLIFCEYEFIIKTANPFQGPISAAVFITDRELVQLVDHLAELKEFTERDNIALHAVFKEGVIFRAIYRTVAEVTIIEMTLTIITTFSMKNSRIYDQNIRK